MANLITDYERIYEDGAFIPQHLDLDETAFFADLIPATPGLRVLDMGSAEGALAILLARRGHRVTAADIAPTHLKRTAGAAREAGVEVKTVLLDIEKGTGELETENYDAIYFMDVLEHLRSPAPGILNLRSLLAPEGTLVINTPNLCALSRTYRYLKRPGRKWNFFDPADLGDFHLQGYDCETLTKLLNFCGLRVCEVVPGFIALPVLCRFRLFRPLQRAAAKIFPALSDNLLVKAQKCTPIDPARQLEHWRNTLIPSSTVKGKGTPE